MQDPLAGTGFGLQLSANAIEEVEVITGGFNAEFGQATSGVVNVKPEKAGENTVDMFHIKGITLAETSPHVFNLDIAKQI